MIIHKKITENKFFFPITIWLFSRILITIIMLLIYPLIVDSLNNFHGGLNWGIFSGSDTYYYKKIATEGYSFSVERKEYLVAFFPIFPLLTRVVISIGIPFEIAGLLINNLTFLGTLIIVYDWTNKCYSKSVAQWTTAALAWFPLSIFNTVLYSESLYLFFSTLALRAFDQKQYVWTALSGAMLQQLVPQA